MYELLQDVAQRPEPFSRYTTKTLWTRPHLASRMLAAHLDPDSDRASRREDTIAATVAWLDEQIHFAGKSLCDLGCGPGLYAERFAERGAQVTGIDFSVHSIEHAKANSVHSVRYLTADYLDDELPGGFDVATLIFCDLCVLSPDQRQQLLGRIKSMLKPGGQLALDVSTEAAMAGFTESLDIANNLMNHFWAASDYVGIRRSLVYPEEAVTLERFVIVEPQETWQIFNWHQYYTLQALTAELQRAGFAIEITAGDLCGAELTQGSALIGVVARSV